MFITESNTPRREPLYENSLGNFLRKEIEKIVQGVQLAPKYCDRLSALLKTVSFQIRVNYLFTSVRDKNSFLYFE